MISIEEFNTVFPVVEPPSESNYEITADWLLNHAHKEPSQRVKVAIKALSKTSTVDTLLRHYQELMRTDVNALKVSSIQQLRKIKEYFMFPLYFLNLSEYQCISFERCLNSLVKNEIKVLVDVTADDIEFMKSIDYDLKEILVLHHEDQLNYQIESFRTVWNRSILNELDSTELSKRKLSKLRIVEIFDIVMNYPSSIPALYDLKNSIDPSQRSSLISSFITNCQQNLLHAGTNTNDIILFLISTIKSFLIVDPRSVLLDNASRPIRKYLKERSDTIPNIVQGLLSYDSNPLTILSNELAKQSSKTVNNLTLDWYPDPIDALPDFRKQDIIEFLISIFDSKEVFITELVNEFSKKLLSISEDYDIEEIKVKLNQLKWKFEENDLNNLDVMVKDILDSEIIDSKIHSQNRQISKTFHFSLLSHLYWPEQNQEQFNLPPEIEEQIDLYFMNYKLHQKGKQLKWIDSGVVTVELEFSDKVISLDVTPAQASIIYCFNNDLTSLQFDEIVKLLQMSEELAKKSLQYWIQMGVLKFEDNEYKVLEASELSKFSDMSEVLIGQDDSMSKYWPFLVGMLRNLGPLESIKVQNLLINLIPGDTLKLQDLEELLQNYVDIGKLQYASGKYSLKN